MHFRVGLTGGVATGKSTVSELFAALGVPIIDADAIARQLLQKNTDCYQQVVEQFGIRVLLDNGEINRPFLRTLVFNDAASKQALENIIHPPVRQRMLAAAAHTETPYCILAVPLLIEANMLDLVDRVVVIDMPEELQLERLMRRDNLSEHLAQQMLNNQAQRSQRLQAANDIIDNQNDRTALQAQVERLHHFYLELAVKYNASC